MYLFLTTALKSHSTLLARGRNCKPGTKEHFYLSSSEFLNGHLSNMLLHCPASSFSTGETDKKQQGKSHEPPAACASMATPAEPSCGDAAYSSSDAAVTETSDRRSVLQSKLLQVQRTEGGGWKFKIF